MRVQSSRFGSVEVEQGAVIRFQRGLIGFPRETSFVLLRRDGCSPVGWLQSIRSAELAFPVVSVEALEATYPDAAIEEMAQNAGLQKVSESVAVMAVITAQGAGSQATVNLLSPIIVNAETRTGAQVVLERSRFSTQEPFRMRRRTTAVAKTAMHASPPAP